MDRQYRLPGTKLRFGLDLIIGLLPVVGDSASALISVCTILEAVRIKARKRTILRTALNLGINLLIGLAPLLDHVLDAAFKANVRKLRLLESVFSRRAPAAPQDRPSSSHAPDRLGHLRP